MDHRRKEAAMTLAWLSLVLAFAAVTTPAMAGDNRTSSENGSSAGAGPQSSAPLFDGTGNLPSASDVEHPSQLLVPGAASHDVVLDADGADPDVRDRVPHPRFGRQALNLADMNGNVCYTMRTYRMKPAERTRDHENLFRGYSECERASNYQIRSAAGRQRRPHSEESAATLK